MNRDDDLVISCRLSNDECRLHRMRLERTALSCAHCLLLRSWTSLCAILLLSHGPLVRRHSKLSRRNVDMWSPATRQSRSRRQRSLLSPAAARHHVTGQGARCFHVCPSSLRMKLFLRSWDSSGGSRGIGLAVAKRLAREVGRCLCAPSGPANARKQGAKVVIAAKTAEPHPKLPGTIYTAAEEIEKAGGQALPLLVDIRNADQVQDAMEKAVSKFGGVDIVVNNVSRDLSPFLVTD